MNESMFYTATRAFLKAFFGIMGILCGFIAIIVFIGALMESKDEIPDAEFEVEILPNLKNVRKVLSKEAPVVLTIPISGVIGADGLTRSDFREMLIESRENTLKNNRVKAILLTMETPGGTVNDADGIYRLIKDYKETYKVPVYAYVDGMCASGGMYIAVAADKIYANDSSIIGSIGVITPSFVNLSKLIEKLGVESLTLYAGKGKDELNPLRPWKADEQKPLQEIINYYYDQFVQIVVSNRPQIDQTKLVSDYGAQVFPAPKAAEIGYIDGSGLSRNDVLKMLLQEIGIEDDFYQVVTLSSKSWFNTLFKSQYSLLSGKVVHELKLTPELDPKITGQFLYLYQH